VEGDGFGAFDERQCLIDEEAIAVAPQPVKVAFRYFLVLRSDLALGEIGSGDENRRRAPARVVRASTHGTAI
jgi:hypothetical protein